MCANASQFGSTYTVRIASSDNSFTFSISAKSLWRLGRNFSSPRTLTAFIKLKLISYRDFRLVVITCVGRVAIGTWATPQCTHSVKDVLRIGSSNLDIDIYIASKLVKEIGLLIVGHTREAFIYSLASMVGCSFQVGANNIGRDIILTECLVACGAGCLSRVLRPTLLCLSHLLRLHLSFSQIFSSLLWKLQCALACICANFNL